MLTANQMESLRLFGTYTAGSFDPWRLMGPAKASCRAHIMSAFNGERTPQSKSGVTAIRAAFYAVANPAGECEAQRERSFQQWAQAALAP